MWDENRYSGVECHGNVEQGDMPLVEVIFMQTSMHIFTEQGA